MIHLDWYIRYKSRVIADALTEWMSRLKYLIYLLCNLRAPIQSNKQLDWPNIALRNNYNWKLSEKKLTECGQQKIRQAQTSKKDQPIELINKPQMTFHSQSSLRWQQDARVLILLETNGVLYYRNQFGSLLYVQLEIFSFRKNKQKTIINHNK